MALACLVLVALPKPGVAWSEDTHLKLMDLCITHLPLEWRRFFMYYIEETRDGVIAPTRVFKKAEFHYYHPLTGEGKGPLAVERWFRFMLNNLTQENWPVVAFCAGVLLCYVSDLANPLNTNASSLETEDLYTYYDEAVERNFYSFNVTIGEPVDVEDAYSFAVQVANESLRDYDELVFHLYKYGWDSNIISITSRSLSLAANAAFSLWMSAIRRSGKSPPSYATGWLFFYKYHEWIIVSASILAALTAYEVWRRRHARKTRAQAG